MSVRKIVVLVVHAFVGWALCASDNGNRNGRNGPTDGPDYPRNWSPDLLCRSFRCVLHKVQLHRSTTNGGAFRRFGHSGRLSGCGASNQQEPINVRKPHRNLDSVHAHICVYISHWHVCAQGGSFLVQGLYLNAMRSFRGKNGRRLQARRGQRGSSVDFKCHFSLP